MFKEIWNKRVDDLTFGDTVKIQMAAAGIAAGITALYVGTAVGVEALKQKRAQKKSDRENNIIDAEVVEES